jgi:CRP-like cAMP-binding protein
VAERVVQLVKDPDPIVCRQARAAIARDEEANVHSTIEKILLLQSAPIFTGIEGEDLVPLARVADEVELEANQEIFKEGDQGTDLFIIVTGEVAVTREGEHIANLGPGEAFGEMAVLDEAPRSATAKATKDTLLLRIGSEEFYEILHEQAEIAEGVIRLLTRRLRDATTQLVQAAQPEPSPLSRY